jgi:hypothetical protein
LASLGLQQLTWCFAVSDNHKPSKSKKASFSVCPRRYVQDFYIGQFRVAVMDLVFGFPGNRKPSSSKPGSLYWLQDYSDDRSVLTVSEIANLASPKCIFLSLAAPLRAGFLYWLVLSYSDGLSIWLFRIRQTRKTQNLAVGFMQRKPGKPKAHLSQFDRTATYRIFISANLGRQRCAWYLTV